MRRAVVLAGLAAALALSGCHKPVPPALPAEPPAQSDYAAPPEVTALQAAPHGSLMLRGTASPQARVRLASPDGSASGTTAGADGRWNLAIAGVTAPRLVSLSQESGGRLIRARGYLALLPGPSAAMLRPTAGARPMMPPTRTPQIGAVDFDAAGAGVVSGRARADRPVRVVLDGQDAGEGRTDAQGWFDVSLPDNLKPGAHALEVVTPDGRASAEFEGSRVSALQTPPLDARRVDGAWRLDWLSPGGGVQSTLLLDRGAPGGAQ